MKPGAKERRMTMQELLTACGSGEMPRVTYANELAGVRTGTVQVIKTQAVGNNGCGVLFDGEKYEQWFHNSDETDGRRYYMRSLKLLK